VKAGGKQNRALLPVPKSRGVELYCYGFMAWCLIKHMDIFTFTLRYLFSLDVDLLQLASRRTIERYLEAFKTGQLPFIRHSLLSLHVLFSLSLSLSVFFSIQG
jgi:hypothetical protein